MSLGKMSSARMWVALLSGSSWWAGTLVEELLALSWGLVLLVVALLVHWWGPVLSVQW